MFAKRSRRTWIGAALTLCLACVQPALAQGHDDHKDHAKEKGKTVKVCCPKHSKSHDKCKDCSHHSGCCAAKVSKDTVKVCAVTGKPLDVCCGKKSSPMPPCCQKGCKKK